MKINKMKKAELIEYIQQLEACVRLNEREYDKDAVVRIVRAAFDDKKEAEKKLAEVKEERNRLEAIVAKNEADNDQLQALKDEVLAIVAINEAYIDKQMDLNAEIQANQAKAEDARRLLTKDWITMMTKISEIDPSYGRSYLENLYKGS